MTVAESSIVAYSFADVLADLPAIHGSGTFGIEPLVIAEFQRRLQPGMHTLETGCGLSTLLFALGGTEHTAITPFDHEFASIRDYCGPRGIDLGRVNLLAEPSHHVLPRIAPQSLDMAFIDGCHGMSMVHVDFLYTALALKTGGTLALDDVHLWPVLDLVRCLKPDPSWRHDATLGKTAFFTKLKSGQEILDWFQQPYVVARTARLPVNWRLFHHLRRLRHAGAMLLRGDFAKLAAKMRR